MLQGRILQTTCAVSYAGPIDIELIMTCLRAIYQRELSDVCTAPARMRARVSAEDVQTCLGAVQARWQWESFAFGRLSARLGGTRSTSVLREPLCCHHCTCILHRGALSHVLCTVWPCASCGGTGPSLRWTFLHQSELLPTGTGRGCFSSLFDRDSPCTDRDRSRRRLPLSLYCSF